MGQVISFISVKGGVGKTTMVLESASCLANDFEKKVLVIDANFSAPNVDLYLDIEPDLTLHHVLADKAGEGLHNAIYEKFGFDIVPASLFYKDDSNIYNLKKAISRIKSKYDFIILDSAPNYEELVPVVAAADRIFVVTTPDYQTMVTTLKAAKVAKSRNTPIEGIIINKIRNPKFEFDLEDVEELLGMPVLAKVRDNKGMGESLFYRKPLNLHDGRNDVSKEIKSFIAALCGEKENSSFYDKVLSGVLKNVRAASSFVGKEKINRELLRNKY
jgi:MinD-like ATPase involved in chromosome partitioning or flagellar assembly